MAPSLQALGIDRLSVEDRIALATAIWDSIAAEAHPPLLTEAQRRELAHRRADHAANPNDVVPWEQVKADALGRRRAKRFYRSQVQGVPFSGRQARGTIPICGSRRSHQREGVMKKVVLAAPAEVALRSLDPENRRRVLSWFERVANWDGDEFVRTHSHTLDSVPGTYVLRTSADFRIFFTLKGDTITIRDIGKKESILTSGSASGIE